MIDRSDPQWYRDAIIYQLHVKSFFDANDDGIGDFAGVAAKLDYVKDLGASVSLPQEQTDLMLGQNAEALFKLPPMPMR